MGRVFHGLQWAALLGAVLVGREAAAYPQYIGKSYTNCGTCHYSPTGGGLLNAYGHATQEAFIPEELGLQGLAAVRKAAAKNNVSGEGENGAAEFHWDIGADSRLLFLSLPRQVGGDNTLLIIPMLLEVGTVLAYGPFTAYATVTPRRVGPARTAMRPFSREHWLQMKIDDQMSVRAGRLTLPFGLKIPDHTQYTREEQGFDKWNQSYAVELNTASESWMVSSALFLGDLWLDPFKRQERGGALSVAYNFPGRAAVGLSGLFGASRLSNRISTAVFARVLLTQRTYLMGEANSIHRWSKRGASRQTNFAGLFRAGWFAMESLDVYAEFGARFTAGAYDLTKLRYSAGVNWQLLPWVELSPVVLVEEDVETGMRVRAMGQLHLIY